MDKNGYVAGGRSFGARVDNIVDVDSGGRGEEGVFEAWERFAVKAPVPFLGWNLSATSTLLLTWT
jgi:hypothetical protein